MIDWRSMKELYQEVLGAFLTWLYAGSMEVTEEGK